MAENPDANKSGALLQGLPDVKLPQELSWEGTFEEYLERVIQCPQAVSTAHERLYNAIMHYGKQECSQLGERVIHYNIFDDPFTPDHRLAVYDIDTQIMKLVNVVRAAANRFGQEKRIILLHGPVGSAKSTIAALLSAGLEEFSKTKEGQTYKPFWVVEDTDTEGIEILGTLGEFERTRFECPLHEEPLRILPNAIRSEVIKWLNAQIAAGAKEKETEAPRFIDVEGDACPRCSAIFDSFMRRYGQDWKQVVAKHLRVSRMVFSRAKHIGIAGVRPKSEKDQDASELTGETNFAALAKFGSVVDPRTFSFSGHFENANRGLFYAEEMLKAVLGFLYDYLGASQEHRVQPKGFMEIDIDEVILGSTNAEEYTKLKDDKRMEALRDRIIKVDIPYTLKTSGEARIYRKFFNAEKQRGTHIAPGTLEAAALWAVLTRLEDPKKAGLSLLDKAKLFNGQRIAGYTSDAAVKELMREHLAEGMGGISPRFLNDQISNAAMREDAKGCVNFFTVIRQIREALPTHQHINTEELLRKYNQRLSFAQDDLNDALKGHLRQAVVGDEEALRDLFANYIDNVMAHRNGEKVKNKITEVEEPADEELMRAIESKVGITDHEEFREKITNQLAQRAQQRERDPKIPPFDWRSDERLRNALELHLFEMEKDKINWSAAISRKTLESSDQEKINALRKRLCKMFGYCDICAEEVIVYVASIFHRGERDKKRPK